MDHFQIVAHRGVSTNAPENTVASFQHALELGADAVELDVRLTADLVPVVYHFFYLDKNTNASGAIFNFTFEQLRNVKVFHEGHSIVKEWRISSLSEIIDIFGGKIGLEIEMKGPEPEAPEIIGNVLNHYKSLWNTFEITSYEPALLLAIQRICPGIAVDLLFPRPESWMKLDVVQYQALHRARLAHARAVHLHPSQLSESVVTTLRGQGFEIHAWDVNDEQSLMTIDRLRIPRICTDNFVQALNFRSNLTNRLDLEI